MSSFLAGFEGHWRRPAHDYKTAVRNYLVVVDTNVLLECYRFSPDARQELLRALQALGDRLWVPHQAISEYHTRRFDVVKEHIELYRRVPETLKDLKNKALQEVYTFAKRCSLPSDAKAGLIEPLSGAFERAAAAISELGDNFDLSLEGMMEDDPILNSLAELLDGKTGQGFSPEEAEGLLKEFKNRAQGKIPPGYKDANKVDNAHGDYFLWEQLIRESERRDVDVLLITNDAKEDWVKRQAGLIVGARPELIAELRARSGKDLLISQLAPFLQTVKEVLGAAVSPSTVAQASNLEDEEDPRSDLDRAQAQLREVLLREGGSDYSQWRAALVGDLSERLWHDISVARTGGISDTLANLSESAQASILDQVTRDATYRRLLLHRDLHARSAWPSRMARFDRFPSSRTEKEDPISSLNARIAATVAERDAAQEAEDAYRRSLTEDRILGERGLDFSVERLKRLERYRIDLDQKLQELVERLDQVIEEGGSPECDD